MSLDLTLNDLPELKDDSLLTSNQKLEELSTINIQRQKDDADLLLSLRDRVDILETKI